MSGRAVMLASTGRLRRLGRAIACVAMLGSVAVVGGCMTLDRSTPRTPSSALSMEEARATLFGRAWEAIAPDDPSMSAFRLLPRSLEAFAARVAAIDAAERTIDLQYYIFHSDDTGLFLVDRLVAAADRGVRVRILVDDMYTHGIEKGLAAFDAHPNIELRIFNPWTQRSGALIRGVEFLFSPRLNRRMHNKLFIADGMVAILGGRNLADEYFDLHEEFAFRDLDVAAVGPMVEEANRLFDDFWNGTDAVPVAGFKPPLEGDALLADGRERLSAHRERMQDSPYAAAVRETEFVQQLQTSSLHWTFAHGHVLGDAPGKTDHGENGQGAPPLADQLREAFFSAKRELLISSPYFVPGKKVTARLGDMDAGGVDVRILTNSLAANDVPMAHAYYAKYRKKLLRGGVELHELRKRGASSLEDEERRQGFGSLNASLHAKTFVVDREGVFIGSLNLDPRSVVINTEVGALIESAALASSVADSIEMLLTPEWSYSLALSENGNVVWNGIAANGADIQLTKDPDTSWWQRFKAQLLGLLPLEDQS